MNNLVIFRSVKRYPFLMLYQLLKIYGKWIIRLFCRNITVNKPELLKTRGPLLIASNHPNSFLDAIIYDLLFDIPVWSLARGDAFKSKRVQILFRRLKILPVYRAREGVENLNDNYQTFAACIEIFKKGGAVLIFSEGLCENEWRLRPLLKGTARLAFKAWQEHIPLQVLPAGINYQSFKKFGKEIHVNIDAPIDVAAFSAYSTDGLQNRHFNKALTEQLAQLVYEIPAGNTQLLDHHFRINDKNKKRKWLLPFAFTGCIVNFPVLLFAGWAGSNASKEQVHHDAVVLAVLMLIYPLYLFLMALIVLFLADWPWALITLAGLPLLLYCKVQYKILTDR